jgi:hypothetical protein
MYLRKKYKNRMLMWAAFFWVRVKNRGTVSQLRRTVAGFPQQRLWFES